MNIISNNEVEVIAKKKSGVGLMYGVTAIALIFLAFMYCFTMDLGPFLWVYLTLFSVFTVISIAVVVKFSKTKKDIIVRKGDTLYFPDDSCKIWQVAVVEAHRKISRHRDYDWGRIVITTNEKVYKFDFVDDVEVVRARLLSLMDDYKRPE